MISFRPMVTDDIPAGLALCRAASWNQRSSEWELFLTLSPHGCRVAVDDTGSVVGTVATVAYQDRFSWIGMVLVDSASQRQGIGMKLLNEALAILNGHGTIKLDATPAGREVYLKLNFVDEYPLSRMQCDSIPINTLPMSSASAVRQTDFEAILEFDKKVFGADRKILLAWMLKNAPHLAFVHRNGSNVKGYCFGRDGVNFSHIGPVIAEDDVTAIDLVSCALRNIKRKPVIIDVLQRGTKWNEWISGVGFLEQRPLMRMYRGSNSHPGIPRNQFAILGPEFG